MKNEYECLLAERDQIKMYNEMILSTLSQSFALNIDAILYKITPDGTFRKKTALHDAYNDVNEQLGNTLEENLALKQVVAKTSMDLEGQAQKLAGLEAALEHLKYVIVVDINVLPYANLLISKLNFQKQKWLRMLYLFQK